MLCLKTMYHQQVFVKISMTNDEIVIFGRRNKIFAFFVCLSSVYVGTSDIINSVFSFKKSLTGYGSFFANPTHIRKRKYNLNGFPDN